MKQKFTHRQSGQYAAHAFDCTAENARHRENWARQWWRRGGHIVGGIIFHAAPFEDRRSPQEKLLWRKIEEKFRAWHKARFFTDSKVIRLPMRIP